jgi:hypothetical protein
MNDVQQISLVRGNLNGRPILQLQDDDHSVLVERDESGHWNPVETLEHGIEDADLCKRYGLWVDREVTSGFWRWKKTERPLDGQVQNDEVRTFNQFKADSTQHFLQSPEYCSGIFGQSIDNVRLVTAQAAGSSVAGVLLAHWQYF